MNVPELPKGAPRSKNLEDRRGEPRSDIQRGLQKEQIEEEYQGEITPAPYWTGERGEWEAERPQEAALDQSARLRELAARRK